MTKEQIKEFCDYLIEQVNNNGIYVWGGQGELVMETPLAKIKAMETGNTNFKRVVKLVNNHIQCDKNLSKSRMFDCSGLGVYKLLKMGLLKSDTTADGLYRKCIKKSLAKIKKGDFVFKVVVKTTYDKKTGKTIETEQATHIGYVVDDSKTIVEAYGRDKGVIKAKLGNGSAFNRAGTFNG